MVYTRLKQDNWEKPPWEFKVLTGFSNRFSTIVRFGYNSAVGLMNFEDVWSVGGNLQYLTSAQTLSVVSTDATDSSIGTGAQTIIISGLNNGFSPITETVNLNGLTPVITANRFLRVSRMVVDDSGTNGVNAGDIIATATGAGTIQAQIDTDLGANVATFITIPDGFYGMVTAIQAGAEGVDSILVDFQLREQRKGFNVIFRSAIPAGNNTFVDLMRFRSPVLIKPHSDIKVRAIRSTPGGDTTVSAGIHLYLIDEREINV